MNDVRRILIIFFNNKCPCWLIGRKGGKATFEQTSQPSLIQKVTDRRIRGGKIKESWQSEEVSSGGKSAKDFDAPQQTNFNLLVHARTPSPHIENTLVGGVLRCLHKKKRTIKAKIWRTVRPPTLSMSFQRPLNPDLGPSENWTLCSHLAYLQDKTICVLTPSFYTFKPVYLHTLAYTPYANPSCM